MHKTILDSVHPYRFCPALNIERLEKIFAAWPQQVNPVKDKNWAFIECCDNDKGSLRIDKLVGKAKSGYQDQEDEDWNARYANGVKPQGESTIRQIIQKAGCEALF